MVYITLTPLWCLSGRRNGLSSSGRSDLVWAGLQLVVCMCIGGFSFIQPWRKRQCFIRECISSTKHQKILNKTIQMMFGSVQTKSVVKPGAGHWWFKVCFQGFLLVSAVRNLNQGGKEAAVSPSYWLCPAGRPHSVSQQWDFYFPKSSCLRQNRWCLAGDLDTWSKLFKS